MTFRARNSECALAMADAAAARRAKRRKERVVRGGKDRLAYITGEKKELAKDAKPLTQDSSHVHDDDAALRTSPAGLKNQHQHHEKPKQRGQGRLGDGGAGDLPRILSSAPPIHNSSARTRTTTRHLGSTAATAKAEESFHRMWARRVLPLVLGVAYWAYVSNDFGGAGENVDDGDVRRRTGFYANAVAWFLTYQVSANESERNRQSG